MSDEPLRIERRDDGVVLLTLALPDRRNAMTGELTSAFGAAIEALRPDRSARCVVVTGEGTAFCSGGDLSWIAESPDLSVDKIRDRMLPFYRVWLSVRELEVPSIAAVNGPAVGAGLCLALACDLRYVVRGARLSAPFTQLGMHAGMAATYLLPEAVGLAAARELLFTPRSRQRRVRRRRATRRRPRRRESHRCRRADRDAAYQGRTAQRRPRHDRGRAAIRSTRPTRDLRNG
jgi:enoyl-CoA hydratase/carnithine racemase